MGVIDLLGWMAGVALTVGVVLVAVGVVSGLAGADVEAGTAEMAQAVPRRSEGRNGRDEAG